MTGTDRHASVEKWFRRRGVPHFIHAYSATEDVLTRALPLLVLVFLVEVIGAASPGWHWWANSLAVLGGMALLLGGWAAANRARGRPALARPERVGGIEVAVFVLVPALLPAVFRGSLGEAAAVAAINTLLLIAIYTFTSYGIVPMAGWALGKVVTQLGATLGLFARALPLLLLVFMFLFINAEVWMVAGSLGGVVLWLTFGLLAVMALIFVLVRVPAELRAAARFETWTEVAGLTAATPVAGTAPRSASPASVAAPSRAEWSNVGLVMVFSQALQVLLIAGLVAGFFVAFGLLAISVETIAAWIGGSPDRIASIEAVGRRFVVTAELLKVAGFLGTFAGLYFAVYAVHDPTFRTDFFEEIAAEIRESLAVRAVYRDAIVPGESLG